MVYILTEEDAEYYSEITKDIDTTGSKSGYIRIGLKSQTCDWRWIGSSQPFEPGWPVWFWQGKKPEGVCKSDELCAMNKRGEKRWNYSKCYYETFFVCGNPGMMFSRT